MTAASTEQDLIIFLHIPKTAGTTLRSIILKQYRDGEACLVYDGSPAHYSVADLKTLDEGLKSGFRIVMGHLTYGMAAPFFGPGRKFKYATFVRDPLKRVLSLYNHLSNFQFGGQSLSVRDFVDPKNPRCREFDNHQTRIISGMKAEFGKCSDAMLNAAKRHILRDFALIGITEYFDESLYLAKKAFDWRPVPHRYLNSGKEMPKQYTSILSAEDIDLLRSCNSLDIELYNFAVELFRERLRSSGRHWESNVDKFKGHLEAQRLKDNVIVSAGRLDGITSTRITGWARIRRSDETAQVKITINSGQEFIVSAIEQRPELLKRHKHPTGNCGFVFIVPDYLKLKPGDTISARVMGDTKDLVNSPQTYHDVIGSSQGASVPEHAG